mgnify:CR=1 FL=1
MSNLLLNPTPWIEESAFCGILGKTNNKSKSKNNDTSTNRPKLAQVISYYPATETEQDGATAATKLFPHMEIHDGKSSIVALLVGEEAQRSVAYTDSQEFDNTPAKGCIVSLSDWYVSTIDLEQQQQQVTTSCTTGNSGGQQQRPVLCLAVRGRVSNKGGHGIGLAKNLQNVHETTKVLQALMAIKHNVATLHRNLKKIMPPSSHPQEEEEEELDHNTENTTTGAQHANHSTHNGNSNNNDNKNNGATTGSPDELLNNQMVGDVHQLVEHGGTTGLERFDQGAGNIHNRRKNGTNTNNNMGKNPRRSEGNKQQQQRIHQQQQQQQREPLGSLGNVQTLFASGKSGLELFDRIAAATVVPASNEDGNSGARQPENNDVFDVYRLNGDVARHVSDLTTMQDLWSNVLERCESQKSNQQQQQQRDLPNDSNSTSAARRNGSSAVEQGLSTLDNKNEGENASNNKNGSKPCSKPIENPYKNNNKRKAHIRTNGSKNQQQAAATPEGWKKLNDKHNPLSPIEHLEDTPVRGSTQPRNGISAMLCSQDSDEDSSESSDDEDAFMDGKPLTQQLDGDVGGTTKKGSDAVATSDKIDNRKEPPPTTRGEDSNAKLASQSDTGGQQGEEDDDVNNNSSNKTNDDTTNTGEGENAAPGQEEREQQAQPRPVSSRKRKRPPGVEAFFMNVERATQTAVRRRQMWAQLPCPKGGDRIRALLKRKEG